MVHVDSFLPTYYRLFRKVIQNVVLLDVSAAVVYLALLNANYEAAKE
jgi:uncharacterized protein YggT (Ycf19 family)